jgi:hypothetical protein
MALNLTREQGLIFRITHRDNVPWILDNGMHARNGEKLDPNYRNIGNVDLIDKRSRRLVGVPPGGTLSDYVPFYFTPYSIMMYDIRTDVSSLPHIATQGLQFVFTNQHAYPPMAEYFADLSELDRIDWALLQSRDFKHDPDDPGKKERYQAEALIWKHVPLTALRGVCCYTPAVEQQVKAEIERRALSFNAGIQRSWYF